MKISVFYFSGTGNTWWIVNEIVSSLRAKNHQVDMYSIESKKIKTQNILEEIISQSEVIGIGYPIYRADTPDIVKEFLISLPKIEEKRVFGFCTQMMESGNGSVYLKKYLPPGYILNWAVHFVMPCNIDLPILIFKIPGKTRLQKMLKRADKKIQKLVKRIDSEVIWIEGDTILSDFFLQVSRPFFTVDFPRYKKLTYIDMKKCNMCNLCVEICPSRSIENKNEGLNILDSCIFCLRCFSYCPQKAINLKFKLFDTTKSRRYKGPTGDLDPRQFRD